MATYSSTDYLNELSRLLRGTYEPSRQSGAIDPIAAHAQIMELARTVFLLHPGAVFYLASMVKNSLYSLMRREISVVEDMLVALEQLSSPPPSGNAIGNVGPTQLRDAASAAFALEFASGSVGDRPELARFSRILDEFTDTIRPNVSTLGQFVLPPSEARRILLADMQSLTALHPKMLLILTNLRLLLDNYARLDLPTKVSQTALINMRVTLQELANLVESSSAGQNNANSRLYLLRALACKVIAQLLASFTVPDLSAPVLTSDNEGPAARGEGTPPFLAQAAGDGTAAEALTGAGPWILDGLSSNLVTLQVDAGPSQTFDLSIVQGPGLHGKNPAPFPDSQILPVWPGPGGPTDPPPPPPEDYEPKNQLHLMLDSNVYEFKSQEWGYLDTGDTFHGPVTTSGDIIPPLPDGTAIRRDRLRSSPRVDVEDSDAGPLFRLISDYYDTVRMQPPRKLGFKHLGSTMFFTLGMPDSSAASAFEKGSGFGGWNVDGQNTLEDQGEWGDVADRRWPYIFLPRVVIELAPLEEFTIERAQEDVFTVSFSALSLTDAHVGFYVRVGALPEDWERYEIIEVLGPDEIRIDTRGVAIAEVPTEVILFGEPGNLTQVTFSPDLLADTSDVADLTGSSERGPHSIPDTCGISLGPTLKTTSLPAGSGGLIGDVVSALSNPVNGAHSTNKYAHASFHCLFREQAGFSGRLTIQTRSRFLSEELGVSLMFFLARPDLQPQYVGGQGEFPGPFPLRVVGESGHEVFGFSAGQKVDPNADPYLSVEELQAVISDTVDADTTVVEVLEEEIFGGLCSTNVNSRLVQDATANFSELGFGAGLILELVDGQFAGRYFVTDLVGLNFLEVAMPPGANSRGFVARIENQEYKIIRQRLRVASKNVGPGSSVEVVASPVELGFPTGVQSGTVPSIEAVNAGGLTLDMSGLEPGDNSGGMVVEAVSGSTVDIEGGVSSTMSGVRFAFIGAGGTALKAMLDALQTISQSRTLLLNHHFNVDVSAIDAAISPVLSPGVSLQSNVNTAKRLLADLLAVLTSTPRRAAEYASTHLPVLSANIEASIKDFTATRVPALDSLLDSLDQFRFDRALSLLITGDLSAFFGTTPDSASFAGAMLEASSTARGDLPNQPQTQSDVQDAEGALGEIDYTVDGELEVEPS